MKKLLIYVSLSSLFIFGCASQKENKNDQMAKSQQDSITEKEMMDKGFSKGTLQKSKSAGCTYIMTTDKYKDQLDPINIEDFFKGEMPNKIWVKFASLRRQSRCNEARPVSVSEVMIRN